MYGAAFRDINDVRTWFFRNRAPFWSLYIGRDTDRKNRIAANVEEKDMDASWNWLSEMILAQSQSGGTFHVHAKNSPSEDADRPTLKERASSRLTSSGFHAIFDASTALPMASTRGIAGYSSQPFVGLSHPDIQAAVEKEVERRISDYEKDQTIESLLEDVKELKKGGKILGISPEQIPIYISMFKEMFFKTPVAETSLKIAGITNAKEKFDAMTEIKTKAEDDMELDLSDEEIDRINECMVRLKVHFGDDLIKALETLTDKVEQNPMMFKMMLQ